MGWPGGWVGGPVSPCRIVPGSLLSSIGPNQDTTKAPPAQFLARRGHHSWASSHPSEALGQLFIIGRGKSRCQSLISEISEISDTPGSRECGWMHLRVPRSPGGQRTADPRGLLSATRCHALSEFPLIGDFHRDPAGAQRPRGDEPRPSMTPPAATTGTATASTTVRRVAIRAPGAGSRSVAHERPRVV